MEAALDGFETGVRRGAVDAGQTAAIDVTLTPARFTEGVVVTARRIEEAVQEVPIPVSVVSGELVADTGAFNVNRVKELIPTVQFYSTNPRNSAINIRGLGAPFGLTNDGIEPGVGLYIDGVFYARPAVGDARLPRRGADRGAARTAGHALRQEHHRRRHQRHDPQAELHAGNGLSSSTTAASTSCRPRRRSRGRSARRSPGGMSFSGTQREGIVFNTAHAGRLNTLNNLGVRGQVLFAPSKRVVINVSVDHTRQRPEGYTQVVAGVAPTLRPANRQYAQIAADLDYTPPSFNAFDRLTDVDTPLAVLSGSRRRGR